MSKQFFIIAVLLSFISLSDTAFAKPAEGIPVIEDQSPKVTTLVACPFVRAARVWDFDSLYGIEEHRNLLIKINQKLKNPKYQAMAVYYQLYFDGAYFENNEQLEEFQRNFLERDPTAKAFLNSKGALDVHAMYEMYTGKLWQLQVELLQEAGVQKSQIKEIKDGNKTTGVEIILKQNTKSVLAIDYRWTQRAVFEVFYDNGILESDEIEAFKQWLSRMPLQISEKSVEVLLYPLTIKMSLKQIIRDSERADLCK